MYIYVHTYIYDAHNADRISHKQVVNIYKNTWRGKKKMQNYLGVENKAQRHDDEQEETIEQQELFEHHALLNDTPEQQKHQPCDEPIVPLDFDHL